MKLDVTRVLKDLYGDDLPGMDSEGNPTGKSLTIRDILAQVLVSRVQGDSSKVEEQVSRFMLALKVVKEDEIELDSGQVTNIKNWVAARSAPMITGQICMILEGKL